jgi:hypothetical protein
MFEADGRVRAVKDNINSPSMRDETSCDEICMDIKVGAEKKPSLGIPETCRRRSELTAERWSISNHKPKAT